MADSPERPESTSVELAPLHRPSVGLAGFLVSGRWPETTREWINVLTLAVRLAAVPGLVPTTSLYRTSDDRPDEDPERPGPPGVVGAIALAGRALEAGERADSGEEPRPSAALMLLHPPSETPTTTPDVDVVASGCVLLPGVPHLGLDHRAAWVEAEPDGTVTRLVARRGVDPSRDPDTAVLAMLMVA